MEMTIEQKAAAYDKALEIARSYHDDPNCFKHMEGCLEHIFPELAETESEDERIRKDIISYLKDVIGAYKEGNVIQGWIVWLEKQGEQKPVEWSEKDDSLRRTCIGAIQLCNCSYETKEDLLNWLRTLKDRVQPQPKPEWSEEDENKIMLIEDSFSDYLDYIREDNSLTKHQKNTTKDNVVGYVNWLKSFRPQPKQGLSEDEEGIIATALSNTYSDDIATKLLNRIKSIHPQKQEWSKEDERMIKIVKEMAYTIAQTSDKQFLERHGTNEQELKNWSLSCSPQKQWKPSEYEIQLLKDVASGAKDPVAYGASMGVIIGGLEQLKAL